MGDPNPTPKPSTASLSKADRIAVFKLATRSLHHWYGNQLSAGMTEIELEDALKKVLGIFGGSGGPEQLSITHQGAGLKIWGGWHTVNHIEEKPLFAGAATIAMAREVYAIPNPDDPQMSLL